MFSSGTIPSKRGNGSGVVGVRFENVKFLTTTRSGVMTLRPNSSAVRVKTRLVFTGRESVVVVSITGFVVCAVDGCSAVVDIDDVPDAGEDGGVSPGSELHPAESISKSTITTIAERRWFIVGC